MNVYVLLENWQYEVLGDPRFENQGKDGGGMKASGLE